MTTRLSKLATAADGRYFSADERRQIQDYAGSLQRRFDAAEAAEQKEEAVLRSVVEEMQKKYPRAKVISDRLFVHDRGITTSAGVAWYLIGTPTLRFLRIQRAPSSRPTSR